MPGCLRAALLSGERCGAFSPAGSILAEHRWTRIHPLAIAVKGSGRRRDQRSASAEGGQITIAPSNARFGTPATLRNGPSATPWLAWSRRYLSSWPWKRPSRTSCKESSSARARRGSRGESYAPTSSGTKRPEQAVQCMTTATDRGLTAQTIQMTRGKGAAHEALRGWGGAAGAGRA